MKTSVTMKKKERCPHRRDEDLSDEEKGQEMSCRDEDLSDEEKVQEMSSSPV
ncbi:hypothetical protein [Sutcliffiella horikoshii]|uniref:hypothetical protein n=1 Tax=Sutcliffiella horikoshii TaxID=79883 RepID=UPI0012FB58D8|nr:hypothetical protein [Sutcliffiella horikoshii]